MFNPVKFDVLVCCDEDKPPGGSRGLDIPAGRWWGGSTYRRNTIYLHILRWPEPTLRLPPIPHKILRFSVLTGGDASLLQTSHQLVVSVPVWQRHPVDSIVKMKLDGAAGQIPLLRQA